MPSGETFPATDPQQALEYDSFGPYTILRVLGEGGMGTVYLAEQTQPIHRQVALKVVKSGMDTRQILARFSYERQAVAMMDHPNIAHVYDAGATEKGRPYFVMEYIDGAPITDYCDSRRLTTEERLELFVPVCSAVQHAHQKGVIHRDLKPSNVLVTEQDGRPLPKVIDFGVAKATGHEACDMTMLTQFGQFVGTPEYISPEQADVVTNDVDTSSDVYSLGVLLYELLVGAVPFDRLTLRKAGLAEVLRIIREEEAPPLHAKLTAMGQTASEIAARRRTDPLTLRRQVAGDLNWIVLKAVEKTRQRRYPSVSELSADIHRHLEDRPVLASPPSRAYRVRKYVRRHRIGVLASAAVAAALVFGFAATAWEASVARGERAQALAQKALAERSNREAQAERGRAEVQAEHARMQQTAAEREKSLAESRLDDVRSLADSMLFSLDDQVRDLPGSTPAREALTRIGMQYLSKVSEQAAGDDRLQQQLAAAYLKLGDLQGQPGAANIREMDAARQSYGRAITILNPLLHAHPDNADARQFLTLATLRQAQLEESEEAQNDGLARARKMAEQEVARDPARLEAQSDLAEVLLAETDSYCLLCNRTEQEVLPLRTGEYVRRALEIRRKILVRNPGSSRAKRELARAQTSLGDLLRGDGDPQALLWFDKAATALDDLIRQEPANVQYKRDRAEALALSAWSLSEVGHTDESVERLRQAVAIQQQLASDDPGNTALRRSLSLYLRWLGNNLYTAGNTSPEVSDYFNQSLTELQKLAADQPDNPDIQRDLASWHCKIGDYLTRTLADRKGGLDHQRTAESIYRKLIREHPAEKRYRRDLAAQLPKVAGAIAAGNDGIAALPLYQESVALWDQLCADPAATDQDFDGAADARSAFAKALNSLGRKADAIAQNLSAISFYQRALVRTPHSIGVRRSLATTYSQLSLVYDSRSDYRAAVEASLKALTIEEADFAARPGTEGATVALWDVLDALWQEQSHLGDYVHATDAAKRTVEIAAKYVAMAPDNLRHLRVLRTSYNNLAVAYRWSAQRQEGLEALLKAAAVFDKYPAGKLSPLFRSMIADDYSYQAGNLRFLEAQEEALPYCRKGVSMLEPLVMSDPDKTTYRGVLIRAYRVFGNIAGDLNDIPLYLENLEKMQSLDVSKPADTAEFWRTQAATRLDIAFGLGLDGKPENAEQSLHQAFDYLQHAHQLAQTAAGSSKRSPAALREFVLAAKWMAFIEERLGDLRSALQYRREAVSYAAQLLSADSATAANRDLTDESNGAAARVQWLLDGGPKAVSAELARGWEVYSAECTSHNDAASGLPAALEAVEMDRELAPRDSQPAARLALAADLQQAGSAYLMLAHHSTGAARLAALQNSRRSYLESRDLMSGLRDVGALPASRVAALASVSVSIDNVDARLAVLNQTNTAQR
jgi:serine/threonine protein kinase